MITRRQFAAGAAALALPVRAEEKPGWRPGTLEIHHIATGRGDATLIVAPSGHMALIDVGDVRSTPAMVAPQPDALRSAGQHVAAYVKRRLAETGRRSLDALVISHFHDDHIGGVGDLLAELDVAIVWDRAWPDYGYPPFEGTAGPAYAALMHERTRQGGAVRRLTVGAYDQILPGADGMTIRTVAAGGVVWTGQDRSARTLFPAADQLAPEDYPNENACSAAFLVSMNSFRAFLGGDLTDWADAGTRPWMNALTAAARASGPVHVSTLPHHGMFDGSSTDTLRHLRARDWVISGWHASHPSIETLERVFNARLYPGPRDVWMTAVHPAVDLSMARLTKRFASRSGTVVTQVAENGAHWRMVLREPANDKELRSSSLRLASPRQVEAMQYKHSLSFQPPPQQEL